MVDLKNHPVLTDIYNLIEGIEEVTGRDVNPEVKALLAKANGVLVTVEQMAIELKTLKQEKSENASPEAVPRIVSKSQ